MDAQNAAMEMENMTARIRKGVSFTISICKTMIGTGGPAGESGLVARG
jgi:hypothetical protein